MNKTTISLYLQSDETLKSKFIIHKRIGNGSFGSVFLVTDKATSKKVALKVELIKHMAEPFLKKEWIILKNLDGISGIPKIFSYGKTDKLVYFSMQLLTHDLTYLLKQQKELGIHVISKIAISMLKILQVIHSKGIIHRDLKPQNIMLDQDKNIYLVDFGISIFQYGYQQKSKQHKLKFVGTPRYANIAAHQKKQQHPKDQIQSLLYVLIYLCKKQLPWMNVPSKSSCKNDEILAIKLKTSRKTLCLNLPKCFIQSFSYIEKLKNGEQVNYKYLSSLFQKDCNTFPKIKVLYPLQQNKNTTQFRRAFSDKQKKPQVEQNKPFNPPRRVSLQQSNLLLVPQINYSGQNSSSSSYSNSGNTSQKTYFQIISSDEQQKIKSRKTIEHLQKYCVSDEHSTSEQSVDLKLKYYVMNLTDNKAKLQNYQCLQN